jgi:hypothetical protein
MMTVIKEGGKPAGSLHSPLVLSMASRLQERSSKNSSSKKTTGSTCSGAEGR